MLDINEIQKISMDCSMTEFVGTTVLDTIGLVIPGVNDALLQQMQIDKPYKSLGLLSSRTGAAGQINAADEAVKSTNTEIISIELPRDTKGWGGHGNFIIIGGETPAEVRRLCDEGDRGRKNLRWTDKCGGKTYDLQGKSCGSGDLSL